MPDFDPDAYLGSGDKGGFDPDAFLRSGAQAAPAAKEAAAPATGLENAIKPITSYPSTYADINRETREQVGRGIGQLGSPQSAMDVARGVGNVAAGSLGYVTSPITATMRTVASRPIEETTGIPKEYTEFALSLLPWMPKGSGVAGASSASKIAAPTAEAIETAAAKGFQSAKASGVEVPAQAVSELAQSARTALHDKGFREYLAPKTFAVLSELENPPTGAIADVADLHGMRRVLGKAAMSSDPTEREAAGRVMKTLDAYLSKVSPDLKEAIGNYAAAKRSQQITGAQEIAERNAAVANSGQNIDNAMRQRLNSILKNPKAQRGFTEDELEKMDQVARGTFTGNAARFVGNLLGGGGGLGSVVTGVGGAMATGSPLGLGIPVLGMAAKKAANASTSRQISQLDEMIRARSPLAASEATQAAEQEAARRWAQAYVAHQTNPSEGTAKILNTTSRGLALALNRNLGLDMEKTLRGLQGPVTGAAQPNENVIPGHPAQEKHGGAVGAKHGFARGGHVGRKGMGAKAWSQRGDSDADKRTHASVHYVAKSQTKGERCGLCSMMERYVKNGPACSAVVRPIAAAGHCVLFDRRATQRAHGGRVNSDNIDSTPTEAQKKAGNYAKDHVSIHGLDLTIENAKGHKRTGVDKGGKPWSVTMPAHYGYAKRTEGKDGDHVDVYLGPHLKSPDVFVVDQLNAETGKFDEHKCFVGFASKSSVISTYHKAFSDGKSHQRLGHIEEMSVDEFKNWLDRGDTTKPVHEVHHAQH